jgi:hypothetical protein
MHKSVSLTKKTILFEETRKDCIHAVPKKYNPTNNMCYESTTGLCDMIVCPFLKLASLLDRMAAKK